MRAFVALDLPDPLRDALERVQEGLPVGRAVPPENLHLTLAFLGEPTDAALDEMHRLLSGIEAPGFELSLSGLDTYGGRTPKVLVATARAHPALSALHDRVRQAAHAAGLELPRERFRPHVTLARFGGVLPRAGMDRLHAFIAAHAWLGIDPEPVDSFSLYRSTLRPEGALHEALASYPLT